MKSLEDDKTLASFDFKDGSQIFVEQDLEKVQADFVIFQFTLFSGKNEESSLKQLSFPLETGHNR